MRGVILMRKNVSFGAKRGFTLLEMLIVLAISSIVITVLATVLASSFRMLRAGETRSQLQGIARNTLDYVAENVATANIIPRSEDRDYNFVNDAALPADGGFGIDARYVVGWRQNNQHWFPAGREISEAWSDRIVTQHKDNMSLGLFGEIRNVSQPGPSLIEFNNQRVSSVTNIFRLAIPASDNMIYYLSDNFNNGQYGGPDVNFPEYHYTRNRREDCVLFHSMRLELKPYAQQGASNPNTGVQGNPNVSFADFNVPVSTNITRLQFEYFHKVPFWLEDPDNAGEALMEDTNDSGRLDSPILAGWTLVPIDVADNSFSSWNYNDIYRDQSVSPSQRVDNFNQWNVDVFYNRPDPENPQNAPPDFKGWLSSGAFVDIEFDVRDLIGVDNGNPLSRHPGLFFGNADGIPDGDGVPDNPVPMWWMPYLEAIRITVIATPQSVIEERRQASGVKRDSNDNFVYYNLDSATPYADFARTIPLTNARDLFIGEGKDVVVSRMVYPELSYKLTPIIYPDDQRLLLNRRADYNYFTAGSATKPVGVSPIDEGGPTSAVDRYWELDNYLNGP